MSGIFIIAAASWNNVIGRGGKIPWHLPDDLRHFKELTKGHPVIMGRKTFKSIGRPLPCRQNIVVTRQAGYAAYGCDIVYSFEEALLRASSHPVFVIGGSEIYRQALPYAQRIELTRVHANVDGDAFFPEIPGDAWQEMKREEHPADERHEYPFTFLTLFRL